MQQLLLRLWQELRTTVVFVTHDVDEAVLLSSRVVVLTKRPARIKAELSVALPRPRTPQLLTTAHFMALKREALELLLAESARACT
jgi:NitT/TauT family transport system ATP-binding protein